MAVIRGLKGGFRSTGRLARLMDTVFVQKGCPPRGWGIAHAPAAMRGITSDCEAWKSDENERPRAGA